MRMKLAITMVAAAAFAAAFVSADDTKKDRKARGKEDHKHEAGDAPASRDAKFRSWDKDGDGALSRDEYPGHPGNFRALDANHDGLLTRAEFLAREGVAEQAYESEKVVPDYDYDDYDDDAAVLTKDVLTKDALARSSALAGFRKKDRNGDDMLTRAEYGDRRTFRRVDRNRDGRISYAEFRNPPPR